MGATGATALASCEAVKAVLMKKPKERLSAKDALNHPWIKQASRSHSGPDAAHELAAHAIPTLIALLHAGGPHRRLKRAPAPARRSGGLRT